MEGAYLFLLIIILSGYLFTKNIGINILQCVIVCALFGGSQDPLDFYNYEDIYNTVKQGYDVSYEIGYVWLNDICGKLGCSYIEFRYIAGILFCSALSIIIRKLTVHPNAVWSSYLIFSAMFDACLLRNSMALIIAIIAILLLVRARSTKEYLFSAGLIALAALFHSAYWVLLFFIPLWILINRKNGIKLVLLIIVIIYMVSIFSDNLLFRIYSHFLIREATIDKYMTGHYANMTGALYNTVKYLFIIFPVLYYYSRHSNNQEISSPKQKSLRSQTEYHFQPCAGTSIFCRKLQSAFFHSHHIQLHLYSEPNRSISKNYQTTTIQYRLCKFTIITNATLGIGNNFG